MDPLKSIFRNSSLLLAAQTGSSLIGMALVVLLPRFLGDVEFGRLHLVLSLTMMFGVAVEFGLTQVLARAIACQRGLARPYLRTAVVAIAILGAALYVALLGTVRLLGHHPSTLELAMILGIVMVGEALCQVLRAVFQAHERMLVPVLARIAGNAFTLAVAVPLLLQGQGVQVVAIVMALAVVLQVAVNTVAVRRLEGFRRPASAAAAGSALLAAGLPFLVGQALGNLYFRMDVVMLGWLTTEATVGWYGIASRLLDALCFVPQVLTMATFPVAARLWVTAPDEFRATIRKTLHVLLVVTVPVVVTLLTLAREIVSLLFTLEAFGPAVPILQVHAVTLGVLFVDFFLVGVLMAIGRERTWIAVAAAACVLSPLLSRLLIPLAESRYNNGGIGAALGTLLTEVFIMACALRLLPAGTLGVESRRVAVQVAGAGVAMALIVLLGRALDLPWMLAAVGGGLAYLALVIRLAILPSEATRWILAVVPWRAPARVV
ncbi:MAG: flippase [Candidatus Rokuibacteriota bacterium]